MAKCDHTVLGSPNPHEALFPPSWSTFYSCPPMSSPPTSRTGPKMTTSDPSTRASTEAEKRTASSERRNDRGQSRRWTSKTRKRRGLWGQFSVTFCKIFDLFFQINLKCFHWKWDKLILKITISTLTTLVDDQNWVLINVPLVPGIPLPYHEMRVGW